MKTNKMAYKVLSVLMAAMMLFGVMAPVVGVAAEEAASKVKNGVTLKESYEDKLFYVSIGDSNTNGYGLSGYEVNGNNVNGLLVEADGAYPVLFKDYLQGLNPDKTVDLIQLAVSGFRSADVMSILSYDGSTKTTLLGNSNQHDYADYQGNKVQNAYENLSSLGLSGTLPFEWYYGQVEQENPVLPGWKNDQRYSMQTLYTKSLKIADVISINLGSNNFSTALWGHYLKYIVVNLQGGAPIDPHKANIYYYAGSAGIDTTQAVLTDEFDDMYTPGYWPYLGEDILALAQTLNGEIKDMAADMLGDLITEDMIADVDWDATVTFDGYDLSVAPEHKGVENYMNAVCAELADRATFYFLSYVSSNLELLHWIGEYNSDAEIMLVNMVNFMKELKVLDESGEQVHFDEIMGKLIDTANYVLAGEIDDGTFKNEIVYADTGVNVEVFAKHLAKHSANNYETEEVLLARMIQSLSWHASESFLPNKDGKGLGNGLPFFVGNEWNDRTTTTTTFRDLAEAVAKNEKDLISSETVANGFDVAFVVGMERAMINSFAKGGVSVAFLKSLLTGEYTKEMEDFKKALEAQLIDGGYAYKMPYGEGEGAYILQGNTLDAEQTMKVAEIVETAISKSPAASSWLYLQLFFDVGDGVACHPSVDGHKQILKAMTAAYENGTTAGEYVDGEISELIDRVYAILSVEGIMSAKEKLALIDKMAPSLIEGKLDDDQAKILDTVQELRTALMKKELLSDEQTLDIILSVLNPLRDGKLTNAEVRGIARHIYFNVFSTEPVIRMANTVNVENIGAMSPADKLELINIVYNVLDENKYFEDAPQMAEFKTLYDNLGTEVDATELVAVFDIVLDVVTDPTVEEFGDDDLTSATAEITKQIMESDKISAEAKMTIVTEVTKTLGNVGLGDTAGVDLTVINDLREALKEYVEDAEAVAIINALTPILLSGAELEYADLADIVDVVYANLLGGHTAEEKIAIIGIIYTVLDEYGYIELGVINAYIYAYNLADQKGYIDVAVDGIDAAIAGIENAIDYVNGIDTEYADIKAQMLAELAKTIETLERLQKDLASGKFATLEGSINTVFEYKDELHAHRDALNVLAKAIGAEIDPYIIDFVETVDFYANMVNDIVVDAYNFAVATNDAFVKGYKDFTATAVKYATMIDPELGAAVEKFLTETPADAMAIVHRYGKDSLLKLVVDAAAASDKIEAKALALVQILIEHGETIYNAVVENEKFDALVDRLEETKAELLKLYEEYEKAPVATALKYEEQIAILEKELYDLGSKLYDLIITASETVDPEIAEMLDASVNALLESLDIVDGAVDGYLTYLDGAVKAMAGDLLASLLENATELGDTAWNVLMKLLHKLNDFLYAYVNDLTEELSDVYEVLNAACIKLLGMTLEEVQAKVDAALKGEYTVTEDSYLAVIGGSYGDRLADALGLTNKYTGMTWDAIDLDELAKADFVVLGYDQAQINGFAADQLAATLGEYLDTVIRETANEYADRVINEYFDDPSKVEALTAEIDALIDGLLASELFAGKTVETMDWADLIGAENVQYVDEVRDGLYALLAKKGITNDFTYTLDLATYIADAVSLKVEKVYEMLGDDAYITIEIPAADFAVLAVESYLYSNAVFQKTYAQTILALNEQNPDVTIAVLGQYNPFVNFEELPLADIYEVVAALASAHSFGYAVAMPNVTYVDISAAYKAEETDLMSFILEYLGNADALALDEAGEQYVLDQILNAYGLACQHVYDDECTDTDCNACGALREAPGHDYVAVVTDPTCTEGGYTTYTCSKCGDTYVADEVEALGHKWVDATCTEPKTCSVCGETEGEALGHTWVDATCTTPKTCSVCGETEGEALGHKWVDATCTEPKTCSVCGETEGEALGHTYDNACDADCNVCGATRTPAEHQFGDWYVVVEATEEAEGKEERKCSVCGHTESRVIPMLEKTGLSTGAVVAIVCGSVAVVAGGAAAALFVLKKKKIF